ncbi:YueH family protein [Metabacillus sp. RGM 3146]|uniref:YueH family protein n=1 Tax=Metabacillus sp. RGM 3146 TaxID=3401092 RepID=UPI003B9AE374
MKIRKASNENNVQFIENVYIYENKKEEKSLIAVPDIEWYFSIAYSDDKKEAKEKLLHSLNKHTSSDTAKLLADKAIYWVTEM